MTSSSNPIETLTIGRRHYKFTPNNTPNNLPIVIDIISNANQFPDESMVNGFDYLPIVNDFLPRASEVQEGIAKLATDADALAGIDHTKIITPKTLATVLDSKVFTYEQLAPSATWIVAHSLGKIPQVGVYLLDGELVLPDIVSSETTITVTFATAQTGYLLAT